MEKGRVHLLVSGRVQGVFFRAYTEDAARELGLKGWVRNVPDQRVEIVAEGDRDKLEKLVQWVKEKGSPHSRVTDVEVKWEGFRGEFFDFRTTY